MKHIVSVAVILGVAIATTAHADARHVIVLKSEGGVDAATRTKVDAAILKLAKNADSNVTAGDITYGDAAAAVGCAPDSAACTTEVLATLAVDEIVATTITPTPAGLKIVVRRSSKTGTQDATTTVAANQSDHLEAIGPLFGIAAPSPPATDAPSPSPPPPTGVTAPTETTNPTATGTTLPPPSNVPVDVDDHPGRRRWEIAGMATGGAMMLVGILAWSAASSTQDDINKASTNTASDLAHLRDLESKGDGQAGAGNLFFIGGLAVAAVSGYFYYRDSRAHRSQTAHVVPTVTSHGAGVALVIGGLP